MRRAVTVFVVSFAMVLAMAGSAFGDPGVKHKSCKNFGTIAWAGWAHSLHEQGMTVGGVIRTLAPGGGLDDILHAEKTTHLDFLDPLPTPFCDDVQVPG